VFGKTLLKELESEEKGDLGRVFRSLASAGREASDRYDINLAQKESQELYDSGQGKVGTDESEFIRILCSRSFLQLNVTFQKYYELCSIDIEKSIKKEFSGNLERALLAIGI
jgi:hypothetical protein